ncbi:MAG: PilZ domain-containing protein [Oscillospiraceae bacterium]|nr:PilZ domain-containing protein [Oscillospiraceae bacterium]
MINKDKVKKVFIYDAKGRLLVMSRLVTFPKDFFKMKNREMVMVKGSDLPLIKKDSSIEVIFEYYNGLRMKYMTAVDISTNKQMNFHVGDGVEVEERRNFYKVELEIDGIAQFYMRGDEMFYFDPPISIKFKNINIGGVFLLPLAEQNLEKGDHVMFTFMNGEMNLLSEVLRVQPGPSDGELAGYGCKFISATAQQEEKIARFLFECQALERERLKKNRTFD